MICAYLLILKTLCLSQHYDVDDDVANGDDDDDVETDDDDDEDNDKDRQRFDSIVSNENISDTHQRQWLAASE